MHKSATLSMISTNSLSSYHLIISDRQNKKQIKMVKRDLDNEIPNSCMYLRHIIVIILALTCIFRGKYQFITGSTPGDLHDVSKVPARFIIF
jgi:hypothetical protein